MATKRAGAKTVTKTDGAIVPVAKAKEKGAIIKPATDQTEYVDYLWEQSPMPTYATIAMLSDFDDIFSFAFAEVRPESKPVRRKSDGKKWVDGHVVASIRVPPSAMPYIIDEFVRAWNDYVAGLDEYDKAGLRTYHRVPAHRTGR